MTELPSSSCTIDVSIQHRTQPDFDIHAFIQSALQVLSLTSGHYEFTFVDDAHITSLHKDHLDNANTTDVITFNLGTESDPHGDIYVCVDDAARNAHALNHSLETELKTLIIHGLLHLIGYTDYDEDAKAEMFNKQDELLAQLDGLS